MAKAKITMLLDLNEKLFGGKLGKLQKRWEKFEGKVGKGVDKIRDKFGYQNTIKKDFKPTI